MLWLSGEIRLAVKRVAIRGREGQIKNPDKEMKARKEWEGWTVEVLTGAKHVAAEVALCHNYTHSLGFNPSGSTTQSPCEEQRTFKGEELEPRCWLRLHYNLICAKPKYRDLRGEQLADPHSTTQ